MTGPAQVGITQLAGAGAGATLRVCATPAASPAAGSVLGTGDSIYKIKAVFWPKDFQAFTAERAGLTIAMDYMDYLVVYLDTCATSGGDTAKITGAAFADLDQARGGGPGLNTTFWGYGENELGQANYDGIARTDTYTWTRSTSTSGVAGEKTNHAHIRPHDHVHVQSITLYAKVHVRRREEHVDRLPLAS